jgi:gluconate kinase
VIWVHLQGSYDLIFKRMNEREGHYMSASMLRSQVDAYEAPDYGIIANVDQDVKQTVQRIMAEIGEQE